MTTLLIGSNLSTKLMVDMKVFAVLRTSPEGKISNLGAFKSTSLRGLRLTSELRASKPSPSVVDYD